MREQFDLELSAIENNFLETGHAVLENGSKALLAITENDHQLA